MVDTSFQVSLNFLDLNLPSLNPEEGCEAWVSLDEDCQSAGSLIGELSNKAKNVSKNAAAQFDRLLIQIKDTTYISTNHHSKCQIHHLKWQPHNPKYQ